LFIFFLYFQKTVSFDYLVNLGVQIYFVSVALEILLDRGQELGLNYELCYISNILRQVLEWLREPESGMLDTNFVLRWQQEFNLVVDVLGGRLEFGLDLFGVDLQHADVSLGWKIALEVVLVVFKELHHISNGFHRVF
jgi:hypothetical protein